MAIPTKKKGSAKMDTNLGQLTAYKVPGYFQSKFDVRVKPPMQVPAFPQKPRLVCRALVKIAIGLLASSNSADVFSVRVDAARQFARFGNSKVKWWYLERVDLKKMRKALNLGAEAHKELIKLETICFDNIPAFFHLNYFFVNILTPIEPHFEMKLPQELPEGTHIYRV